MPNQKFKSRTIEDTGQNSTNHLSSQDSPNTSCAKRMSVSLSADAARLLEFIAQTQGITQNEALRKAIATEAYLLQEMMQGSKVLLQTADKEVREVVFR